MRIPKIPTDKELYQEYSEISGREPNPRLYQEMVKRNQGKVKVLALDLEWTLILNADTPCARSGLFEFLEAAKSLFERVVIFTAVKRDKFQEVAKGLVTAGDVPEWFVNIEYIEWSRKGYKDLAFIPGIKPHEALIVDDQKGYINPEQLFQWVWIQEVEVFLNSPDNELSRVLGVLEMIQSGSIDQNRILNALTEYVDSPNSGIKRAWICGPLAKGSASVNTVLDLVIEIDDLIEAEWIRKHRNRGVVKVFTHSWLFLTFWIPIKVTLLDDLSEPPANAIIIINTWEDFNVEFNRVEGGIEISFPDLEGCQGFCPHDGSDTFDRFTLQAIEPAKDALRKWLQTARPEDIPQKSIAPKFPFTVSGRLPWRKNDREQKIITIALDLEGTTISDEVRRIPRPGLYTFLEGCRQLGRVVIYTMVDPDTTRDITQDMVAGGHAPEWFSDVDWVDWFQADTDYKDLDLIPGSDAAHAYLVDDHAGFIHPRQRDRWVQVMFYDPADQKDRELELALWRLRRKIALQTGQDLDLTFPGNPTWALIDMQDQIDELTEDNFDLQAEKEQLIKAIQELEKEHKCTRPST